MVTVVQMKPSERIWHAFSMKWQRKCVDIKQLDWVHVVLVAEVEKIGETWVVGHIESVVLNWFVAFEMLADIWTRRLTSICKPGLRGQVLGCKFGIWGIEIEFKAMETEKITEREGDKRKGKRV